MEIPRNGDRDEEFDEALVLNEWLMKEVEELMRKRGVALFPDGIKVLLIASLVAHVESDGSLPDGLMKSMSRMYISTSANSMLMDELESGGTVSVPMIPNDASIAALLTLLDHFYHAGRWIEANLECITEIRDLSRIAFGNSSGGDAPI